MDSGNSAIQEVDFYTLSEVNLETFILTIFICVRRFVLYKVIVILISSHTYIPIVLVSIAVIRASRIYVSFYSFLVFTAI